MWNVLSFEFKNKNMERTVKVLFIGVNLYFSYHLLGL